MATHDAPAAAPGGVDPGAACAGTHDGEAGTGMIASLAGVVVFLALLLFATQVVVNLYAASTVTAAAFDAARIAAGADAGPGSEAAAEAHARSLLGAAGEAASFSWSWLDVDAEPGPDRVALRVVAPSPTSLVPGVQVPFEVVDRTVEVRVERLR